MTADAVVVLGGRPNRVPVGRRLLEEGVAPELLVFNATGEGDGDTIYVRPDPYTTRGEARAVARIGRERGWRSVVVVTSTYHVTRARLLVERCYDGELRVVGARLDGPRGLPDPLEIAHEWAGFVHAFAVERGC